jgi:hypothetical protein
MVNVAERKKKMEDGEPGGRCALAERQDKCFMKERELCVRGRREPDLTFLKESDHIFALPDKIAA